MTTSFKSLSNGAVLEALAIEDGTKAQNNGRKPSIKTVLRYCGSLVRRSVDEGHIELAHFSVEEFFAIDKRAAVFTKKRKPRPDEIFPKSRNEQYRIGCYLPYLFKLHRLQSAAGAES